MPTIVAECPLRGLGGGCGGGFTKWRTRAHIAHNIDTARTRFMITVVMEEKGRVWGRGLSGRDAEAEGERR